MISFTKEKLIVIHSFPVWLPQTQTWMYNQVKYLPHDCIENHIVCEKTANLDQFGVPNIHSLYDTSRLMYLWDKGIRRIGLRQHLNFLIKRMELCNAKILHSHFGNIGWRNIEAVRKTGVKHIVTFYGRDVNLLPKKDPAWNIRYKELFKEVDCILCEGPFMAKSIIQMGCPEHKVKVHHLGVEVNKIIYQPRAWKIGSPIKILIAASFREKKGIPYAIEAIARIQSTQPVEITIVGDAGVDPESQNEKNKILHLLGKYNLIYKTRLLGFQKHDVFFSEAYNHHIFISPSITAQNGDTEGGAPVSIIEMAATGIPVISTFHADIPEVICHNKTGLLVDEQDIDGIVDQLKWLIANFNKWESLSKEARYYVENNFNATTQGYKLSKTYMKIL
ncbi:Glycosyltransferase, family I [Desulfonema limicola]|uniref:Glycosyltransferase, family I n=1 Tax=Desulfonema limicola TaxID=45656 RepID=A0A975BDD2_9BACT|nr:glycosyltransferase [Desulfonema limicola]QTA83258.1 Glycosyltransferase, family I [Desulfonema limicola]